MPGDQQSLFTGGDFELKFEPKGSIVLGRLREEGSNVPGRRKNLCIGLEAQEENCMFEKLTRL